tara:strand:- start:814 stop:1101 length:288 start_codon:yes stop_codon:yes gene_type:complete
MTAYWIAIYKRIDDSESLKVYAEKATLAIKKFNGKILIRGGKKETLEGLISPRTVLIEFPTMKDALECYDSDEYKNAKKAANVKFDRHLQIVEGI